MLTILRTTLLKQNLTHFLILQIQSPINNFSSNSTPNSTFSGKRGKTSEQVISLLKTHGFTQTHISKFTQIYPKILSAHPQKSIAPRIQFLHSIGISTTLLPRIVNANPSLLLRSVENRLKPCHKYLKTLLIDDENVVKMLKKDSRILKYDFKREIAPNISLLKGIGVPSSLVLYMLLRFPFLACYSCDKFRKTVEEATIMGFNPTSSMFVIALSVLCGMNKMLWDRKWKAYKSWGLSDDEILMAFRSQPNWMKVSEEKIMKGMDFFVNKMGFEAVMVARDPVVLFLDLENRVIPRWEVMKVLVSNGILKKHLRLGTFLKPTENRFLEKFVNKYKCQIPDLLNVYLGKRGCLVTGHESKGIHED